MIHMIRMAEEKAEKALLQLSFSRKAKKRCPR